MIYKAIDENIKKASNLLLDGKIIVYPTDTLLGIGVDATNSEAIEKLNSLKNRKSPLSIIVGSIRMLKRYAVLTNDAKNYLNKYLPGKFTFLLNQKKSNISEKVTVNSDKIGIRIPDSRFIIKVVNYIDRPVITTSINIHGEAPINDINEINRIFNNVYIFANINSHKSDGSTIVDLTGRIPQLVRNGDGKFNLWKYFLEF